MEDYVVLDSGTLTGNHVIYSEGRRLTVYNRDDANSITLSVEGKVITISRAHVWVALFRREGYICGS